MRTVFARVSEKSWPTTWLATVEAEEYVSADESPTRRARH
jgi:hypothetical protein